MKVNTNLNVFQYLNMVNDIADGFYSEQHEYQPHIGMVETMRIFYANCVVESEFDSVCPHDTDDVDLLAQVLSNEDFIDEYNKALIDLDGYKFNFACAYRDAMDIVDSMKNSHLTFIGRLQSALVALIDKVNDKLSDGTIDKLNSFADDLKAGKIDYYKFFENFADSDVLEESLRRYANSLDNGKYKAVNIGDNREQRRNKKPQ